VKKVGGYVLVITGFLACPCHLVFTLPLVLALLGGTALGSFLAENTGLVAGVLVVYFLAALGLGFLLINARTGVAGDECATCAPEPGAVIKPEAAADRGTPLAAGRTRFER